ncbi:MAG: heterodisulfide reductase-related iron-sulfur binding cluster [Planctomycetaceae bacterium]|nr:4Fe-4S dicluster domain-containing protein [Planctomycetaceae bacterium]
MTDIPSRKPLEAPSLPADNPMRGFVPHQQLLSCIHCGLCTSSCPTYLETGNENDSPRGRIHLMRGVEEGRIELTATVRGHLDLCLDCRSCETACPSGVKYGQLIETFRVSDREKQTQAGKPAATWFEKLVLHELFPNRHRLERLLWPAWLMQQLGLDWLIEKTGLLRLLPLPLQRMQRMLPRLRKNEPNLPREIRHLGPVRRARVGLFLGCVSDAMFRHVHWATVRVLQHAGCDVLVPDRQQCCGAIEFHSGQRSAATERAKRNLSAFAEFQLDAILVNVAGCGAMLKEYSHLAPCEETDASLHARLQQFAGKVQDINEFLAGLNPGPLQPLPLRVVYQDACHLRHAQQIEREPRHLLRHIPELELLDIPEANICCGAAGSYNLQQPEMSDQLGERKIQWILSRGPEVIATANAGCALQLQALLKQRGLKIPVVHPVELLDASQRGLNREQFLRETG